MSIQVPNSSLEQSTPKRKKSQKRKHGDLSSSTVIVEASQSPTKKSKHDTSLSGAGKKPLLSSENEKPSAPTQLTAKTPFYEKTISLYLPIPPISLQRPVEGLCTEHISPLLLTYYPPLKGVVLSYSNPRLSELPEMSISADPNTQPPLAVSVAEYGASFIWLTVDFLVLSPPYGTEIQGYVSVQAETHLGLVCWNLFNATISFNRLPQGWRWHEGKQKPRKEKLRGGEESGENIDPDDDDDNDSDAGGITGEDRGYWTDDSDQRVDGMVTFRVVMMDAEGGNQQEGNYVSIIGTMLDDEGESQLLQQQKKEIEGRHARKRRAEKNQAKVGSSEGAREGNAEEVVDRNSHTSPAKRRKHRLNYD